MLIQVYNMMGQKGANLVKEEQAAGHYTFEWKAGELPGGMYLIKTDAQPINGKNNFTAIKKALLLK